MNTIMKQFWRIERSLKPCAVAVKLPLRFYGYVHVPKKKPPHMLGPANDWRKCFIVNPNTETQEPLLKYQWLTKTAIVRKLPHSPSADEVDLRVMEDMKQRATEFLAFQRKPQHMDQHRLLTGLFQSLLASVWLLGDQYPHLIHSNLTVRPKIECYWRKNNQNFISFPDPLQAFHTSQPLQLFTAADSQEGELHPPLQYHPTHIGLFQRSFDQISVSGGWKRLSPYPFAHTLFLANRRSNSIDQADAVALMNLFAQAAGQSVQNGHKIGRSLNYPLATQAILSNGKQFGFYCFQLNTLNFDSNKQSKQNVLWIGPKIDLYEDINFGTGVVGYSNECAGLLLKFMLKTASREKPTLSGFALTRAEERAIIDKRERKKAIIQKTKNMTKEVHNDQETTD